MKYTKGGTFIKMAKEIHSVDDIDPKYAKNYSEDSFWDKIAGVLKSAGLTLIYKALQLFYVMQKPECTLRDWAFA